MAENIAKANQYQYAANSSLVLQADRSSARKRDKEPTGESESLYGKIDPKDFGSRAEREKPKDVEEKKKKSEKQIKEQAEKRRRRKEDQAISKAYGYSNVMAATENWEGLSYRPRTRETRETYEHILTIVYEQLGDQSRDVIRSAADDVLETLKTDTLKDFDKKREVESVVGPLSSERFAQLVNLTKKITDYATDGDGMNVDGNAIDEELGVAVVFDEEEEEGEEGDGFEIMEDDDDEDEGNADEEDLPAGEAEENEDEASSDDETGFKTVVPGESASKKQGSVRQKRLLSAHDIDAHWLQRQVAACYSEPHEVLEKTQKALAVLDPETCQESRECENSLNEIFDYDHFDLVEKLVKNRDLIYCCTKLARVDGDERKALEAEMQKNGQQWVLDELRGERQHRRSEGPGRKGMAGEAMDVDLDEKTSRGRSQLPTTATIAPGTTAAPRRMLDLDELAFDQGSHLMSNKKVKLPEGSFKRSKKGYEEIHVPAPKPPALEANEKLLPIASLPEWTHKVFPGAKSLNRVQSRIFPAAFKSDENLLLCAPTGAGKTNVAMLTILQEINKHRDPATDRIDVDAFKIVYIAPMKALVQEMVGNFSSRLEPLGIQVAELTGDRQLTKQQIAETQIIVTTPEKWDVITRKASDRSYTALVRLIIIDEIHLLHDDRGPVLESIVSRTLRNMEQTQELVRLVGLSATLPNYADVAAFLRVDPKKGLFHFDSSYRPCPLKQIFIGVTEKKAFKRFQTMNEVCYEKALEQVEQREENQVLVFVHSRKETAKTAKSLRDMALEKDTMGSFLKTDSATREILQSEAATVKDTDLQELLQYGFAIHHAGMTRADRTLVEELFNDGHIKVLCSTATLAWGVNLPAHAVIIKGTQIYSPEKGNWVELSPQDVLQMLGRAGRPQYDTYGEGIIITAHAELQYYLSLLNTQLPIESQFIKRLADNLNAEIVLGTIRNRDEAVQWLGYSYLYVRMLRNPVLYSIPLDELDEDRYLVQKRVDLIHSAAHLLDKCNLIKYDKRSGRLQTTELGRVASHYYISHHSMATYNQHLKPMMSIIELFRVFALSDEFKYIPVREEEKLEMSKMLERVPIPVKESLEEPMAKINVLLQAYISQLKLEGFALVSDMVYVTQSAGRILRAIFEICLRRGWSQLTKKMLDLCKMVEKRSWMSMSPLRQFKAMPHDLIRKLERKEFPWERYFDLTAEELGELVGQSKLGRTLYKFVHQFPKLDLQAHVQPVSRSLLKMELTITPDFEWDEKVHGAAEAFWILVEDVDGENILHHEYFVLKQRYSQDEHLVTFTVPVYEPLPPNYFVTIVADRWMHAETKLPVSFKHLILPEKYATPTELHDLEPVPVSALKNPEYEQVYAGWIDYFNPIQTQTFNTLYTTDDNAFVGAPTGSGKTVCAEFALLRLWSQDNAACCVYVAPFQELVDQRVKDWKTKFGALEGGKAIVALTGETSADLKLMTKLKNDKRGHVVACTPTQWDLISRRWKHREPVQAVSLFIADELHLLDSDLGPTYEVIVSRMRYMIAQTERQIRIVALSTSLANAKDIGDWMGVSSPALFNFAPAVRPVPLEISIQSHNIPHFPSLMLAMAKPTYLAITEHAGEKPAIVFVPSRKQCRLTAMDIITYCTADDTPHRFLHCKEEEMQEIVNRVNDRSLAEILPYGIGFYHEAMTKGDARIVEELYESGAIQVVVASRDTCWSLPLRSHMVVVMGAQYFEGREHRYADYPIRDVLQMMGRAGRANEDETAKCVLMCQGNRKEFYKKFMYEGIPVESHLDQVLHDHFNAEIVTKTIENKQDAVDYLTWTFLYRRMAHNPNYYGLQGVTHRHLSDHLSELVENTLNDLQDTKCAVIEDEMDVSPLNLGLVAAYYNINYTTVDMFSVSLKATTKLKGLLEIVSSATEFDTIPIRHQEDGILKRLHERLPVKLAKPNFSEARIKANILLQAHFSRLDLPADLQSDQKFVLSRVLPLLQACVDVISSNGWLMPALATMELSQMSVQAMWDSDSPLKQVPRLTRDTIDRLKQAGVESVFDVMEMEDEDRDRALQIEQNARGREILSDMARFVNRYPNIEVGYEVVDAESITTGDQGTMNIQLEREWDEDEPLGPVMAPRFPQKKDEGWWIVIGDPTTKTLLGVKRVTLGLKLSVKLDFQAPKEAGRHTLKLYLMSDSYNGCDQELDVELDVAQGESSDEEMSEADD